MVQGVNCKELLILRDLRDYLFTGYDLCIYSIKKYITTDFT